MHARGDAPRAATRDDVARRAGVSSAVVSYVLNDGPRPVADATRARVLAAIAELDYRPNATARALRLRSTRTLALLVPDIGNPFFAELAKAVQTAAFARGYAVTYGDTEYEPERERAQLAALAERQPDGVLVIGGTPGTLAPLQAAGVPVVTLDRSGASGALGPAGEPPSVGIDDEAAARAGIRHLQQHGHERIALIAGPEDSPAARARRRAWTELVAPAVGTTGLNALVATADYRREGGYRAALQLLDGGGAPTAVFVSADVQAIGALRAFAERGVRVPDELAVLSFDGTSEAEFTSPPLSVIRQPLDAIAEAALGLLLDGASPRHVLVSHELVARASCGPHRD
ncbi:LacI family DNA-binding transcriptional regulator [Agromyces soli]|uniref:LacI family transcriptional regulator n=1 Tax=Agromyces soli TaxID=659012 RepID=A0ABY4AWT4_9MICO|nr:LacI family DNA-binding transcriptional regulator [Agromyces soli]UOE26298.1 LacI family transcriptional regulator [Agromyces soli]